MKRILPLLLVALPLPVGIYACSSDSSSSNNPTVPGAETPGAETPGAPVTPVTPETPATEEEKNLNPTLGIAAAAVIASPDTWSDGPVWSPTLKALIFSAPLAQFGVYKMDPAGGLQMIRTGAADNVPNGNTLTGAGDLVTVEAQRIVRIPAANTDVNVVPTIVASTYSAPDAGAAPGTFDQLNDVVARKDGTLYVTDPGYGVPTAAINRIFRVSTTGVATVVEAFQDVPRPNGIALSPDEASLYVGFSKPVEGTLPFVRKYAVNADGSLGTFTKFADVGPADSEPDGMTVDKAGNVYIATKTGIEVRKPAGDLWGKIAMPAEGATGAAVATGLAFGGDDLKTLYITTTGFKIYQIKAMPIAGVAGN